MTETAGKTNKTLPAKQESPRMFDRIAHRYDLLNRLLSMRRDVAWRKELAAMLPDTTNLAVLDIATGTADVLLTALRECTNISQAVGVDMAGEMLRIGHTKAQHAQYGERVHLIRGDALKLPVADESFGAVTIAFGIRNVTDVRMALQEMNRVLKPGGKLLILEFSLPDNRLLRRFYLFYFRHILPRLGSVISGDSGAYRYLNRTVEDFPYGERFCAMIREAGFATVRDDKLSFGIASIYSGSKM